MDKTQFARFTIQGLSAMLQHNPQSLMDSAADKKKIGPKRIPTPEVEAAAGCYLFPDGKSLCFPAVGIRNSILTATKGQRVGNKAALPYFTGAILVADEFFPLVDEKGDPLSRYSIDRRRAVVQDQGITRARPRIELPWYIQCSFEWSTGLIDTDQLKTVIEFAGKIVGIGDYRPEKKKGLGGWFGRYTLSGTIEITS